MKKRALAWLVIAPFLFAIGAFAQSVVTGDDYSVLYDGGRWLIGVGDSTPTPNVPPQEGALFYELDAQKLWAYTSGTWSSTFAIATLTGDVTGDITGDITGAVTGNVTGDLTGDVTGNVTGDVTGDVTGNVTGDITTGTATGMFIPVTANAAAALAVVQAHCGGTITNTGDADGSGIVLTDDPTAGCRVKVVVTAAQTITITTGSGETLMSGDDTCALNMTSATIGDSIVLESVVGGSGGVWHGMPEEPTSGFVCNDA